MSKDSGNRTIIALLAGTAIGAAIGVGVGMLLAPDKGAETREKVKQKLDDIEDELLEKVGDIIENVSDKAATLFNGKIEDVAQEETEETEETEPSSEESLADKEDDKA